jgi:uncharacterized membrane protein (UPF0127 family)
MSFKVPSIVLLAALALIPMRAAGAGSCEIRIINSMSKPVTLKAELALTDAEKSRGLMHRRSIPENSGMLFVFGRELELNFWMKNTYVPLSIAYIGKNGVINEIYDMKPLDASIHYPSRYPAKYALEVPKGWFAQNGVAPGCRLILDGCLGK